MRLIEPSEMPVVVLVLACECVCKRISQTERSKRMLREEEDDEDEEELTVERF